MFKQVLVLLFWASFSVSSVFAQTLSCEKDNKISLKDAEACCCTPDTKTSDSNDFNCKPTALVPDAEGNKKCPPGTTKISNQEKTCICHFSIKR